MYKWMDGVKQTVKHFPSTSPVGKLQMNLSLAARILTGRPREERLSSKVNVRGAFPEPWPSEWYPDTLIAKAGFIFLVERSEGGEILGFPGTCGPELSRLEPHLFLLPYCTAWWLSNPHGLQPRSSGPSLFPP